jgi:thiamine pyrophosphokinase
MHMRRTVVVSNGTHPIPSGLITPDTFLVVADGGLARTLVAAGPIIETLAKQGNALLIGDLDSADPADVDRWRELGGSIEKHSVDKEATDLELALDRAIDVACATNPTGAITVIGGNGVDRFDHLLGEIALLGAKAGRGVRLTAIYGTAQVEILPSDSSVSMAGAVGDILSLLPCTTAATGVTTSGLRWPLTQARLAVGSTRGVSNEFVEQAATISVAKGPLMVIKPKAIS